MKYFFLTLVIILLPLHSVAQGDKDQYVILLHGIAKSSEHMQPLADVLANKGYDIVSIDYPSTNHTLKELVDIINFDISSKIKDDKVINFVGYSMGGLLVRAIIEQHPPKKLGKVIQLASPNHGSEVADFLQENYLYKKIYGPAGQELTTDNDKIKSLLGEIDYELAVIAGNSTVDPISSYLISGNDDGKVSIQSTKVKGMKDHIVVSASHIFFPSNKDVHKQVIYFLENGKFDR